MGTEYTSQADWSDVFPFLVVLPPEARAPLDLGSDVDLSSLDLSWLSAVVMERLVSWRLEALFPTLNPDWAVAALPGITNRARNVLTRQVGATLSPLMAMSVRDILDLRNVGAGTIDNIVQVLAAQALRDAASRPSWEQEPLGLPSADQERPGPSLPLEGHAHGLALDVMGAFRVLSEWQVARGCSDGRVLDQTVLPGAPQEVQQAWAYLQNLTATDFTEPPEDVAELLGRELSLLGPRELRIAECRLFSPEPSTLESLGHDLGITRERVRQVEAKTRANLAEAVQLDYESPLGRLAAAVRQFIGTVCPLADLESAFPALTAQVQGVGQPAWRVLDVLDDGFEISGRWAAVPSMGSVRMTTTSAAEENCDEYGVVAEAVLAERLQLVGSDRSGALRDWLEAFGYEVLDGYVLTRVRSANDHAAGLLRVAGSPLSVDELLTRMRHRRTPSSLKNALAVDSRLVRVDRDKWALTEWGLDEYTGIRDLIRREVQRSGGRIRVSELTHLLSERFSIAPTSVSTYCGMPPFTTADGFVSIYDGPVRVRKTLSRTKYAYVRNDELLLRVDVSREHLRGSGSPLPVALAVAIGLRPGDSLELDSSMGPQTVYWTGAQPSVGSIRRLLVRDDVEEGAPVFLVFNADGGFNIEHLRRPKGVPASGLDRAMGLVGRSENPDVEESRRQIADALQLPPNATWASVIGLARDRGEPELADTLTGPWLDSGEGTGHLSEPHDVGVDDILELL